MEYDYRLYLKTSKNKECIRCMSVSTPILKKVHIGDTIAIPNEDDDMGGFDYYNVVSRTFYEVNTTLVEIVAEKEEL